MNGFPMEFLELVLYVASSHLVLKKIGKQRLSYIIKLILKSNPYSKLDFWSSLYSLGEGSDFETKD